MPMKKQMKPQFRAFDVQRNDIDEENRTLTLSFSSEASYERYFGEEILDHGEKSVRLERLNGKAPLLMEHDPTKQIGVVETAQIEGDRKGRALVRFGNSALAQEIWQDVKDGIRSLVSVGYRIHTMVEEKKGVFRVSDWEPFEISIVSVPADASVGVGRDDTGANSVEIKNMTVETKVETPQAAPQVNVDAIRNEARNEEQRRIREIDAMGSQFKVADMARSFINDGKSVEAMREAVLAEVAKRGGAVNSQPAKSQELDMTKEETGRYSIMNAIRAHVSGDWKAAGFEREVNIAMADKMGRDAQGFFVPTQVLGRALDSTTATTAAELVGTDHRADMFIELLRPRSIVASLGARMMDGLVGNVDIPKQTGAATFQWLAEGGDVAATDPTTGTVTLSPKTIAGATEMTRRLMKQSSPSVEQVVMNDLLDGLALAIDLAALAGSGAANQPRGILNTTGVGSVTLGAGVVTHDNVVDIKTAVNSANAMQGALGWAFNATQRGIMEKARVDAGSGQFVLPQGATNLSGYRYELSNQLANDKMIFGNWSDLLIGSWGGVDVKPDEYAKAASGGLVLRVFQDLDIAVRHAESFAVGAV